MQEVPDKILINYSPSVSEMDQRDRRSHQLENKIKNCETLIQMLSAHVQTLERAAVNRTQ